MPPKKRLRTKGKNAPDDEDIMDRSELVKMLNYFRYHSSEKSKAPADFKDQLQKALQAYQTLTPDKKKAFLAKFRKNRKDLSWLKEFTASEGNTKETINDTTKGMFLKTEILAMNGFQYVARTEEEIETLALRLIKQSEQIHNFTSETAEHPDKRLTMHLYVKGQGEVKRGTKFKTPTFSNRVMGTGESLPQALAGTQGMLGFGDDNTSSSSGVQVKIENPDHGKAKQEVVKLKTLKGALERHATQAEDLLTELEVAGATKPELSGPVQETSTATTQLKMFIGELRKHICKCERLTESDDCKGAVETIDTMTRMAGAHMEGIRFLIKRMKPLL